MASTTVTCRDIPLTCVSQWDSDGLEESSYIAVHQLSAQLWKRFDTPRPSVQKKIEDLHIPLLQCSKAQVKQLRKSGAIAGFRATIISLEDAERVCDELKLSREKRGLLKHPKLKKRKRGLGKGGMKSAEGGGTKDRAEKKLGAFKKDHACGQVKVVDRCAPIGSQLTPTPSLIVASPIRNSPSLSPEPSSPITPCYNLPANSLSAAEKPLEHCHREHAAPSATFSRIGANSSSRHFATSGSRGAEDLNPSLFAARCHKMATPRSQLTGKKEKQKIKLIRPPRSRHFSHSPVSGSRNSNRLQHQQQHHLSYTKEAPSSSSAPYAVPTAPPATTVVTPLQKTTSEASRPESGSKGRLCSPVLDPEEEGAGGQESAVDPRSSSERQQSERFHLVLSSEEEEEARAEMGDGRRRVPDAFTEGDFSSQGRQLSRRIATKLRLFAQTTSPNAAAAASPGKQLPIGSTRNPPYTTSKVKPKREVNKHFWVKISRKLVHTKIAGPPLKRGRGRPPLSKNKPKIKPKPVAALSSFATMKRARNPFQPASSSSLPPRPPPPLSHPALPLSPSSHMPQPEQNLSLRTPQAKKIKLKRRRKSSDSSTVSSSSSKIRCLVSSTWQSLKSPSESNQSPHVEGLLAQLLDSDSTPANLSDGCGVRSTGDVLERNDAKVGATPLGSGMGMSDLDKPLPPVPPTNSSSGKVAEIVAEKSVPSTNENSNLDNLGSQEGTSLLGGNGKFEFNKLFNYYPPKLVLLDGDLCPERSLSVCDMERSKLSSLPPDHPFLGWSMGQPTTKPHPPAIKPTRKSRFKSKRLDSV